MRSAVVTGASSGIGRAIATSLARRGYATVLIARRAELLNELAAQLRVHAPSTALPLDLDDTRSIGAALVPVIETQGPFNVLINNAGFGVYRPFPDQGEAEFASLMRVNFVAPVELTRLLLPGMLSHAAEGRIGHVLNICSAAARIGPWGHTGYAASKGALRSFTESLAAEYHSRGVGVTIVYPGIVDTPYFRTPGMAPLWPKVARRAITAERVAAAAVSAIGTRRLTVYIPRLFRVIDLIAAMSPGLALHIVRRGSTPP
jgi:short-subunit dehydrogenase